MLSITSSGYGVLPQRSGIVCRNRSVGLFCGGIFLPCGGHINSDEVCLYLMNKIWRNFIRIRPCEELRHDSVVLNNRRISDILSST